MATVKTSTLGDVVVIGVRGYFGMNEGGEFRQMLQDQMAKGAKKIVIDLLESTGIDSSGLGNLVISYTKVANSGGQLVMVAAPKSRIMDTFQVTSVIKIFKVFDSVASAIQGLTESKTA